MTVLLIAAGCRADEIGTVTALRLDADGIVKASVVSDFDKDYYDSREMRDAIEEAVRAYNAAKDEFSIQLLSVREDSGRAEVEMYYRTADDYAAFNNVTFFGGSISEITGDPAWPAGVVLTSTADGSTITTDDLSSLKKKACALVFGEPAAVTVPGKVLYVSGGAEVSEDGVVTAADDGGSDSVLDEPVIIIYE